MNTICAGGRRTGKTHRTIEQLVDAYVRADLKGPLTAVLQDPTLVICLENIIHANQADEARKVDMRFDGKKLLLTARPQASERTRTASPKPDLMRLAAGDQED